MLHAILVGIDRYSDPDIKSLSFARADAESMSKLIEEHIEPTERNVRLLLDEEATLRNIRVAISDELPCEATDPQDMILIYFAGHGSPETRSGPDQVSHYLVAHDTEYDNIHSTGIDMDRELQSWFERIREPRLVFLFIDACFSGRAGGRTFEGPRLSRIRSKFRGSGPVSLKALDLGEGRVMVSACDDDQLAREDKSLAHGVFTYYLMKALKRSEADADTIGIHTLYEEVAHAVRIHTKGRQVPIINGRTRIARLPRLG